DSDPTLGYTKRVLLAEGRLPVTSADGAGCGARGFGCQPNTRGPWDPALRALPTRVRGARWTPPGKLLAGTPQARPEVKECRSRAPEGAPSRSQGKAARLASVPGPRRPRGFAAPASSGALLPLT